MINKYLDFTFQAISKNSVSELWLQQLLQQFNYYLFQFPVLILFWQVPLFFLKNNILIIDYLTLFTSIQAVLSWLIHNYLIVFCYFFCCISSCRSITFFLFSSIFFSKSLLKLSILFNSVLMKSTLFITFEIASFFFLFYKSRPNQFKYFST